MTNEISPLERVIEEIARIPKRTPIIMRREANHKLAGISQEQILASLDPAKFQYESEEEKRRTYVDASIERAVVRISYDELWKTGALSVTVSMSAREKTESVRRDMRSEKITTFAEAIDQQYRPKP